MLVVVSGSSTLWVLVLVLDEVDLEFFWACDLTRYDGGLILKDFLILIPRIGSEKKKRAAREGELRAKVFGLFVSLFGGV